MSSDAVNGRFSVLIDHLTADVITSVEQFEGLREEWDHLFNSCDNLSVWQSFTWNYVWWKHFGKGIQLSIFTVREKNMLVGIAPLMVEFRFGVNELEPIGGEHHYNFALIMDSHRDDIAATLVHKLSTCFPKALVHIPYFAAGTVSIDIFMAALSSEGWKEARWTRNISHYVSEGSGFDSYMANKSKKSRYNLKRERSRLDETGLVNLHHFCLNELTDNSVERIAQLQKKSWLARRGQESLASPFYKEVLPALAQNNHAEIFLYEQNSEDIAYILNLYSGDICYCLFIGFSETKAQLSPGKVLMMENLQKVLDRGITVYDFLYGEGEYKRFWANRTKYVCRAVCYKGFRASAMSWFPHRLHGTFAKYQTLKNILVKIRRLKTKIF
ncbi:MAG: GNAT family N-acetyltransferase [Smithella sp.]|jgi:CelD/BcsL family acetyltransferase involved in cellulose biosynthesis